MSWSAAGPPFSPEDPDFSFFRCFFSSADTRKHPGGLEGWAEGKDQGRGCGEGQKEGRVGADRVCSCVGRQGWGWGAGPPPVLHRPSPHSYSYGETHGGWGYRQVWAPQAGRAWLWLFWGPEPTGPGAGTEMRVYSRPGTNLKSTPGRV